MCGGIVLCGLALCCCFDADSTVWRLDEAGHREQVALREISVGDSVLSMDPGARRTYWEPVLAKAHYSYFDGGASLSISVLQLDLETVD